MMTYLDVRDWLKKHIPILRKLVCVEAYIGRLVLWRHVVREIRGRTAVDRLILWRSIAAAPITALADLGRWHEPLLIADADVISTHLGAFGVRRHSDDLGHLLVSQHEALFKVIRNCVRPGDVVIDAGANIGAVTVFLGRLVGSTGKVVAVEMMPDTGARLDHNIAINNLTCVQVIKRALFHTSGQLVTAQIQAGFFGQASIVFPATRGEVTKINVLTITIDEITAGVGSIALMKMDLEGAELDALRGAVVALPRIRAIVFESWTGSENKVAEFLSNHGFVISPIDGRNFLAIQSNVVQAMEGNQ